VRDKYLYVRILEACNAGCFMCGYANSRDRFRMDATEGEMLFDQAAVLGVKYARFTGGEPLLHREIATLVELATNARIGPSLITNGSLLPRKIDSLADAGLQLVVVSLDGAESATHDTRRATPGCFSKAVEGIARAKDLGVAVRVNTVVGPHNYQEMIDLQRLLTDLAVDSWELSALKIAGQRQVYDDHDDVRRVGGVIYDTEGRLRPLGKRWYGETPDEQSAYLQGGRPPRATGPTCHTTEDVLYLDGKNGHIFVCSCIPHHPKSVRFAASFRTPDGRIELDGADLAKQREYFRLYGPKSCTGCTSTAAGYSDLVASGVTPAPWTH
jgi:cytosylglucuronate decarboxylase